VQRRKVRLIYNGVDATVFRPGPKGEARGRLGITGTTPLLVFVGNLFPVKGIDVLVAALARLHADGGLARLTVIGQGPLRPALERQVAELGMSDRVTFLGPLPQAALADWYRAADLFVLPSHSEGVPNVLLESMACHTPYVATNVGGVPEIHAPEVGRLVPSNDPAALADAIAGELSVPPRGPDAWPAPRLRTDAVAEVAEFLEAVVARRAGLAPVGA
jgi:glycosyltransferase involved in cell wall biosynthesis